MRDAGYTDHSPNSLPGTLWKKPGQQNPGSVADTMPRSSSNAFPGSQLPQNKVPKLTATSIEQPPRPGTVQDVLNALSEILRLPHTVPHNRPAGGREDPGLLCCRRTAKTTRCACSILTICTWAGPSALHSSVLRCLLPSRAWHSQRLHLTPACCSRTITLLPAKGSYLIRHPSTYHNTNFIAFHKIAG